MNSTLRGSVLCVAVALAGLQAAAWAMGSKPRGLDLSDAESMLEDARVQAVFQQYLAEWSALDTEGAAELGLHGNDGQLTSRDDATYRALKDVTLRYLRKVRGEIDPERLSGLSRIRYRLLLKRLEVAAHDFDRWDYRRQTPGVFLRIDGIRGLLYSDALNTGDRARGAMARLEQLPKVLGQGKVMLTRPPRLWTRAAIRQAEGALGFLETLAPLFKPYLDLNPEEKPRFNAAVKAAKAAVADWKTFLEQSLPSSEGRFAVGPETYDIYLRDRFFIRGGHERLLRAGRKAFRRTQKDLKRLARDIERGKDWRDLLAAGGGPPPAAAELTATYRREAEGAYEFLKRQGVVDLPDAALRIVETPAYARALVPDAAYRGPAPLDLSAAGELWVTPVEGDASAQEAALRTRHNLQAIRSAVARFAWPGAHLAAAANKRILSDILRTERNPSFTGGWALYSARLAAETGYQSSPMAELSELHARLAAAARLIVDAEMHTGGFTVEEARKFLVEEARLTPEQAEAEVLLASMRPGEAAAAYMGFEEIQRLSAYLQRKLRGRFTLKEFHRRLHAYGSIPPALLGELMVEEWLRS